MTMNIELHQHQCPDCGEVWEHAEPCQDPYSFQCHYCYYDEYGDTE